MVTIAQAFGIVFGCVMLIYTIFIYRRKKYPFRQYFFWTLLWIFFVVGILFFDAVGELAIHLLEVEGFDLFLYVAVLVLFFSVFLLYNKMNSIKKSVDEVVGGIALRDFKEKKK